MSNDIFNPDWLSFDARKYNPNIGFILRLDLVTELPISFQYIDLKYGFFKRGGQIFTDCSIEHQIPERESYRTNKVILLEK